LDENALGILQCNCNSQPVATNRKKKEESRIRKSRRGRRGWWWLTIPCITKD